MDYESPDVRKARDRDEPAAIRAALAHPPYWALVEALVVVRRAVVSQCETKRPMTSSVAGDAMRYIHSTDYSVSY